MFFDKYPKIRFSILECQVFAIIAFSKTHDLELSGVVLVQKCDGNAHRTLEVRGNRRCFVNVDALVVRKLRVEMFVMLVGAR